MKTYPYSETRVYLSAAIAGLSLILAVALLSNDLILTAYYFLATAVITTIAFLLKRRLYTFISTHEDQESAPEAGAGPPWRTMLLVLLMSVAIFVVPLLSTQILNPAVWFILIAGFTSGVSISELILYLQTRR